MNPLQRSVAGIAGAFAAACGIYAMLVPALAVLYLTDGYHLDWLPAKIAGFAAVLVFTAWIAGELLVAAALLRAAVKGSWPPRRFFWGPPPAVIFVLTLLIVTTLVLTL